MHVLFLEARPESRRKRTLIAEGFALKVNYSKDTRIRRLAVWNSSTFSYVCHYPMNIEILILVRISDLNLVIALAFFFNVNKCMSENWSNAGNLRN